MAHPLAAVFGGEVEEEIEPEEVDDESEIIEYVARFSRTVYSTAYCNVIFEAEAGLSTSALREAGWDALDTRHQVWYDEGEYDHGDTELVEVEEA